MNKFWYNFNNTIFKASLAISIILALILSIVISAFLSNVVGGWAILIWILILGIGILIILELHSLWGLIIEYVGTVNKMSETVESLNEKSEKREDIDKEDEKDYEEARILKATSTWECLYCHRINPDNKSECLNCKRPKPTSTWNCSYCHSANPVSEKQCLNCNRLKPTSSWKCSNCHSVNPDTETNCRICKHPRWTKEPEKWACTHCGNPNNGNEEYCVICGSHKGNSPKIKPQTQNQDITFDTQSNTTDTPIVTPANPTIPTSTATLQETPQKWICSSCGSENRPVANFCHICGKHK